MNQGSGPANSSTYISPRNYQSPPHSAGYENNDAWSGKDSDSGGEGDDARKRKRPMSVSCELCKQRKVKCDRGQPTCGWCARNGQVCEYRERKKPGLRAGYGRELESRLDRLETILQTHGAAIQQLSGGSINTMQAAQSSPQDDANIFNTPSTAQMGPGSGPDTSFQQTPTAYTPQTPMGDFRDGPGPYSASFPPAQPQEITFQPQAPPLIQAPQPYYTNNPAPLESPSLAIPDRPPAVSMQDHDFPPYDLLYALADLYFKHINTWCPILHRRTTLDALFGASSLDEADRILLHAIVATTLRFSNDPRLTTERKEKYHLVSKQKVLLYGLEKSSVKAVQAMVILALDLCGSSNGPPGWNLLALITRAAVQLGLSVEMTSCCVMPRFPSIYTLRAMVLPEPKNWVDDESRRRLFWMIYVLDRYATVATAFEFALDEKEIDRRLPCRDDLFARNQAVETRWFRRKECNENMVDRPENLGSFSYYIEVVGILAQIHQFLRKPVDISKLSDVEQWQNRYRELDEVLNTWKSSLPKEYGNLGRLFDSSGGNKIVNCGWVMLHATYHTTVIRLHSSAAYPTNRSPIFNPSYTASQRCLSAVDSLSSLCRYVTSASLLSKLGPPFAFSVWVAARLLLVHSSTIDHSINPTIHFFVSTLRQLAQYWAVADRYAMLIQRVLDEYSESERSPVVAASGERVTPGTVKLLADMRRCAYDVGFLISRQPLTPLNLGRTTHPGQTPQTEVIASVSQGNGVPTALVKPPSPNELEYLDVFDFFNMPRLPVFDGQQQLGQAMGAIGGGAELAGNGVPMSRGVSDFNMNITNFIVDQNTDWFVKG